MIPSRTAVFELSEANLHHERNLTYAHVAKMKTRTDRMRDTAANPALASLAVLSRDRYIAFRLVTLVCDNLTDSFQAKERSAD